MRVLNPFLIIVPIIALDFYVYRGLQTFIKYKNKTFKSIFFWTYWLVSLVLLAGLLIAINTYSKHSGDISIINQIMDYNGVYLVFFIFKLCFAGFNFIADFYLIVRKIPFAKAKTKTRKVKGKSISRGNFIRKTGAVLSMVPVLGLIHGIGWGRYNFTLHHKKVSIKDLPDSFEGFKIVQLSDAHLGSFAGQQNRIQDVVLQINELEPDVLVFTGDMVNNFSYEMSGWVQVWKNMKAKYGKFSILGNHDYGNYSVWPSDNAKKKNLQEIIRQEKEMGFDVLLNENRTIEIGKEKLFFAGVENWGKLPFPQNGNLKKALNGIPENGKIVLLSHDPDHFEHHVKGKSNVDLTLSGHTHGFQFGFEIGNFKFSPVQLRYKRWAGLYEVGDQNLYVNRGLGYLAFPGRVGIWPEITLLELTKA